MKVCEKHDCAYNYRTTKHGTCPACFAEAHCHNLEDEISALKSDKDKSFVKHLKFQNELMKELSETKEQLKTAIQVMHELKDANIELQLKSEKEPEKEAETDWSKVEPGTLVLAWNKNPESYPYICFFIDHISSDEYPFKVTPYEGCAHDSTVKQCRLYQPDKPTDTGGEGCTK